MFIMGELNLDGTVQSIKGALPIAIKALEEGFEGFYLTQRKRERSCHREWSESIWR